MRDTSKSSTQSQPATQRTGIQRRDLLGGFVAGMAGISTCAIAKCPTDPTTVCNVTQLYSVKTKNIVEVRDVNDIRQALRQWPGPVSVGGGRYSMGGQTAVQDGWQTDMRRMRGLVSFDAGAKVVRVQSGMRWRDLQTIIDPHNLSIRTMQSYSNFTVGGSVSVNCHGRYVGHGPIVSSVRALQLVMADGEILETTSNRNSELFYAAIGGYGGLAVISEVELSLDENFAIERHTTSVSLEEYPAWFAQVVASDADVLLHNADLIPADFDKPLCVTWRSSKKPLTVEARLQEEHVAYRGEKLAIWAMTELPGGNSLRKSLVQPLQDRPAVVWRNYEASMDVASLEPYTRNNATYVLQEYFIPIGQFASFARAMARLMKQVPTGTLNVSIRHSPPDVHTQMRWAREEVFSFVVYYKQRVGVDAQRTVGSWTRNMIDIALKAGGTYYLPYQMHATQSQFDSAYPQAHAFRTLRKQVGASRFTNSLWQKYEV